MKSKLIIFSFIAVLLNYHDSVAAVECVVPPACSDLGFTQTYSDCINGDDKVDCPLNTTNLETNKYYCSKCKLHWTMENNECVAADNCSIYDVLTSAELYNGKVLTYAAVAGDNLKGDTNSAIYKAAHYAPKVNGVEVTSDEFKAGTWYLPTIGEWMEAWGFSGDNVCSITAGTGNSGAKSASQSSLDEMLTSNATYWSITEAENNVDDCVDEQGTECVKARNSKVWGFQAANGGRQPLTKTASYKVRYFNLLENDFCPKDNKDGTSTESDRIKVGDNVCNTITDENDNKKIPYGDECSDQSAIGRVVWVSESGQSAKIMSLSDEDSKWMTTTGGENEQEGKDQSSITNYSPNLLRNTLLQIGECNNYCPYPEYENWNPIDKGQENTNNIDSNLSTASPMVTTGAKNYTLPYFPQDPNIGKGTWYVPSISEWIFAIGFDQLTYATAIANADSGEAVTINSDIGSTKSGLNSIKDAFDAIRSRGYLVADFSTNAMYWSSTENKDNLGQAWGIYLDENNAGKRVFENKVTEGKVRYFNYLKDMFCQNAFGLEVGNVVFIKGNGELVIHNIEELPSSGEDETPVGVIVWAGRQSAKIISLKEGAYQWATNNTDAKTNAVSVNDFEVLYAGQTQGSITSCEEVAYTDKFGIETTLISKEDNKSCSDDKGTTYKLTDGNPVLCYPKECMCASDKTYVRDKEGDEPSCETAYRSCGSFSTANNTINTVDNSSRDLGCYPYSTDDENSEANECSGDGAQCTEKVVRMLANTMDVQKTWKQDGYPMWCFPNKDNDEHQVSGYSNKYNDSITKKCQDHENEFYAQGYKLVGPMLPTTDYDYLYPEPNYRIKRFIWEKASCQNDDEPHGFRCLYKKR